MFRKACGAMQEFYLLVYSTTRCIIPVKCVPDLIGPDLIGPDLIGPDLAAFSVAAALTSRKRHSIPSVAL
jgi:hypothetical protein